MDTHEGLWRKSKDHITVEGRAAGDFHYATKPRTLAVPDSTIMSGMSPSAPGTSPMISHLPSHDGAASMHRVHQLTERGFVPLAQVDKIRGKHLKGSDNRLHGPPLILVRQDHDHLATRKRRTDQLETVGQRTPMRGIGRKQVSQHIVV
jgi:hypothetical protein